MSTERGQGDLVEVLAVRLADWWASQEDNEDEAEFVRTDPGLLQVVRRYAEAVAPVVRAHVDAEVAAALEGAADEIAAHERHSCFRPQGDVGCGEQRERDRRVSWLRAKAARVRAQIPTSGGGAV